VGFNQPSLNLTSDLPLLVTVCAVECTPLKRALEATFAAVLPKAAKPFIFLVRWASWVPRCMGSWQLHIPLSTCIIRLLLA